MNEYLTISLCVGILLSVLVIVKLSRIKYRRKELERLEKECRLEIKVGLEERYGKAFAEGFDKFYMEKIFINLFKKKTSRQEEIFNDLHFQLEECGFSGIDFDIKKATDYAINFAEFIVKNNKKLINTLTEI